MKNKIKSFLFIPAITVFFTVFVACFYFLFAGALSYNPFDIEWLNAKGLIGGLMVLSTMSGIGEALDN